MSSVQHNPSPRPAGVLPTDRRPRRTLRFVLGVLAAWLLTAGIGLGAFLAIDAVNYRYWPSAADFEGGQAAHVITLEAGETFLLWKYASFDTPECSAKEVPSGDEVMLTYLSKEKLERGAGAVPYVAFARGRTDSSRVSVTCAQIPATAYDSGEPATYYVDQPDGPVFVDGLGPWWPAPVALIVAGLALMAATAATAVRARRARQGSA